MIYRLQKKLIRVSGVSVTVVFVLIFVAIAAASAHQLNVTMDALTDRISANDGVFPEVDSKHPLPPNDPSHFITEETRFSTRFFTVRYDSACNIESVEMKFVASVTEETARAYAEKAVSLGRERGWAGGFRYRVYHTPMGQAVVFVDGTMNRSLSNRQVAAAGFVLVMSLLMILVLIRLFSKRAAAPAAESYEKQKQFITDASHELKTPLTLILANLDIVEGELGKNGWLDDIRAESERMSALVKQLVMLARMDEDRQEVHRELFSLSDAVMDTVSEFQALSEEQGKPIAASIPSGIDYCGDEAGIRCVVSILLDNAVKYCDPCGEIRVSVSAKRHPVLSVENSCRHVGELELDRLFDRFYRADGSRTYTGSFGIGLSIARAIVRKNRGEICAYRKGEEEIGFRVVFR